jgi:hypothetical protein
METRDILIKIFENDVTKIPRVNKINTSCP